MDDLITNTNNTCIIHIVIAEIIVISLYHLYCTELYIMCIHWMNEYVTHTKQSTQPHTRLTNE